VFHHGRQAIVKPKNYAMNFNQDFSIDVFEQIKDYDEIQRENFKEMDNLYRENAKFKSRTDQLERENKELEQGLKEVIENLKTYTPGRYIYIYSENCLNLKKINRKPV